MAKEIFVIYNKNTGFIDGGAGRIDRIWDAANADGSTISENILVILGKDPDRRVIYFSDQILPNPANHKIVAQEIIDLTDLDKQAIEDAKPKSDIELLQERVDALENA